MFIQRFKYKKGIPFLEKSLRKTFKKLRELICELPSLSNLQLNYNRFSYNYSRFQAFHRGRVIKAFIFEIFSSLVNILFLYNFVLLCSNLIQYLFYCYLV